MKESHNAYGTQTIRRLAGAEANFDKPPLVRPYRGRRPEGQPLVQGRGMPVLMPTSAPGVIDGGLPPAGLSQGHVSVDSRGYVLPHEQRGATAAKGHGRWRDVPVDEAKEHQEINKRSDLPGRRKLPASEVHDLLELKGGFHNAADLGKTNSSQLAASQAHPFWNENRAHDGADHRQRSDHSEQKELADALNQYTSMMVQTYRKKAFPNFTDSVHALDPAKSGVMDLLDLVRLFKFASMTSHVVQMFFEHIKTSDDYIGPNGVHMISTKRVIDAMKPYFDRNAAMDGPTNLRPGPPVRAAQRKQLDWFFVTVHSKFKNVRQLFRFLDAERNGTLGRREIRDRFALNHYPLEIADLVYDYCNPAGYGEISFEMFANAIGPFVRGGHAARGEYVPMEPSTCEDPERTRQAKTLMREIGARASVRFNSIGEFWRGIDEEKKGYLTKEDMTHFFRGHGASKDGAELIADWIDEDGSGTVDFSEFANILGPYITMMPHHMSNMDAAYENSGEVQATTQRASRGLGDYTEPENLREICSRMKGKEDRGRRKETQTILKALADKADQKFRRLRDCFAPLDKFRGGHLRLEDVEDFFVKAYLPDVMGRTLFEVLDDGSGMVSYVDFMNTIGPSVLPGYTMLNEGQDI